MYFHDFLVCGDRKIESRVLLEIKRLNLEIIFEILQEAVNFNTPEEFTACVRYFLSNFYFFTK